MKKLKRTNKIIIAIAVFIIIFMGLYMYENLGSDHTPSTEMLANTSTGTVEKVIYGNPNAEFEIALITGIHPREPLSIDPVIKAAEQYAGDDVKIVNYRVNVTDHPQDYEIGRSNGENLIHDYVNPEVAKSKADVVLIAHSHMPEYGEGFYVATPAMDNSSVKLAKEINKTSDINYYPVTGNETYQSTSAELVSKPIAESGHPTLVYEIPENITDGESTNKTVDFFGMLQSILKGK